MSEEFPKHETGKFPQDVVLTDITKSFGENHVLKGVSLSFSRGSTTALIGPSGSGKTTLLRIIGRLTLPDSGGLELMGRSVNFGQKPRSSPNDPLAMQPGMVFQQYNLFPHMCALDNITLAPQKVLKYDRKRAEDEAKQLLQAVGLSDKAEHFPSQLSGGQQQRVAIARALAMNPRILLFDEVTSALDPELKKEVLKVIQTLAAERERTLILVTHEMQFAEQAADTIVFMADGRVVESGRASTFFSSPREARTRSFIADLRSV